MYKEINKVLGTDYKSDQEIDWRRISKDYKLSPEFIEEFKDYLDWKLISSGYHRLEENFIRKYKDLVHWDYIVLCQKLSEEFILEFKDFFDSHDISSCQVLSENFIRNNTNMINWDSVSSNQLLSWDFMLEFKDHLDWDYISGIQPFIDPSSPLIQKSYLSRNYFSKIYQETKDQGWFLGYVNVIGNFNFILSKEDVIDDIGDDYIKARVWWRDLELTRRAKKYKSIRLFKYV